MGKRILAFLLAIVLTVGMIPVVNADASEITANSDAKLSGTNAFGNLLADSIYEETGTDEATDKSGYNVTALTIEGNVATVTYDAMEPAVLLVALYDENTGILQCSGKTVVDPEQTVAAVTIEGTMPSYYEASAYLLDQQDHSPLCSAYSTPLYTAEMQALLQSKAEDYEAEGYDVLKLDTDTSSNFAVYSKSVVVIEEAEGINQVVLADAENSTYVLENCDQQILNLTPGTVMAYVYGENIILVKVASLHADGTTVTISGDALELEEVFAYMKIETGSSGEISNVDESTCDEGVTFEGIQTEEKPATRAWDGEATAKGSLLFTLEKEFMSEGSNQVGAKLSGTVDFSLQASLSFYISAKRKFVDLRFDLIVDANVTFSGKLSMHCITLAEFKLPCPLFGVVFECAPSLVWEFEASAILSDKVVGHSGFIYDSETGFHSLDQEPEYDTESRFEGKLFFGVKLETAACLLDDNVLSIGFSVETGIQITGQLSGTEYETIKENASKKHTCDKCLSLRFDWHTKGSVFMKMLLLKLEWVMLDLNLRLGEMYVSFDSEHSGSGWGKCPHYLYRVTVKVQDQFGDIVPAQEVFLSDGTSLGKTGKKGTLATYLAKGKYNFYTVIDGEKITADRDVRSATRVVLTNNPDVLKKLEELKKLMISSLKITVHDTYAEDQGGFGELPGGLSWRIYRSGQMIIEGDGQMDDFDYSGAPWYPLRSKIKAVEFIGDITNVGCYAFADCTNLKTVILEESTQIIAPYAFSNCTSLQEIRLPVDYRYTSSSFANCTHVEKIQYRYSENEVMPDRNCYYPDRDYYVNYSLEYICRENLDTVIFEEGIQVIGAYAFSRTTNLDEVIFAESIEVIGPNAFEDSSVQKIELPESLLDIGSYAFSDTQLTGIVLPDTLQSVGSYAFSGCKNMTILEIPDWLADKVASNAFSNCTGLEEVTIPVDISLPAYGIFAGCNNVKTIYYTKGQTGIMQDRQRERIYEYGYFEKTLEYQSRESLQQVFFADEITRIGNYALMSTPALSYVELPATLESIGQWAFRDSGITSIELPDSLRIIESSAFENTKLTAVKIPETAERVGSYAFAYCYGLTQLTIADALADKIETSAFHNCTGLEEVTIPVDISIPAYGIFAGCTNVHTIHYTKGQTGLMQNRQRDGIYNYGYFEKTLEYQCREKLTTVTFEDGITHIGDYSLMYTPALSYVKLPSTLEIIGQWAFRESGITSIKFPDTLRIIDSSAFENAKLTAVNIPETAERVGSYAFAYCYGLTQLTIADALADKIETNAFQNCTGLEEVTIPVDISIPAYGIFTGCTNVHTIHYTRGQTGLMQNRQRDGIYNYGYFEKTLEYQCRENLATVTFEEGITHIGNYSLMYTPNLAQVQLPSTLESVGQWAFRESGLQNVLIPENVVILEYASFEGCPLEKVYFEGNPPTTSGTPFYNVTATAYYPNENANWTSEKMANLGANMTWVAYDPPKKQITPAAPAETVDVPTPTEELAAVQPTETSAVQTVHTSVTKKKPVTRSLFDGDYSAVEIDGTPVYTARFAGLQPYEQYVLIVVLDPTAEDLLAHSNLLALRQAAAEADGTLIFDYTPRIQADVFYAFAAGASSWDLQDAQITFPPMTENGDVQSVEPVVRYGGNTLLEEADYVILGTVDYTEAGEYTCYIRGVRQYTGMVCCTYRVDKANVSAWNVALGDQIGVNFRVAVSPSLTETAVVNITVGDTKTQCPVTEAATDNTTGEYLFSTRLAAAQMTEPVLVQITSGTECLFEKSYSVAEYAHYILDEANGYDAKTVELVTQMLHLGGKAQTFFGYNTDSPADAGISVTAPQILPPEKPMAINGRLDGVEFYGATLLFTSRTAVRFYFTGDVSACHFRLGEKALTPVQKDGKWYVEIGQINPQDLDQTITICVSDGVNTQTVSYSPLHYLYRQYSRTSSDMLKSLLQAMYGFHLAAKAYLQ